MMMTMMMMMMMMTMMMMMMMMGISKMFLTPDLTNTHLIRPQKCGLTS